MINRIPHPPKWREEITKASTNLIDLINSQEIREKLNMAQDSYDYWDKVRHYPLSEKYSHELLWTFVKFNRLSNRENTPIKSKLKGKFNYTINKIMFQRISFIDSYASGLILSEENKQVSAQRDQLILSGITEEAIASSQIEGANTSRKVAKEMILSKRKPRTQGEQMIINNFQVMQQISQWKDLPLSMEMIQEIQKIITTNTLPDQTDSGRFRKNSDNIHVVDSLTGESVFVPPDEDFVKEELKNLISFANEKESKTDFIHPVIKASIIHFWLAYLHPFVDGNGRTARAIFYWYLLNRGYWLFKYLSVSRIILDSKAQYDRSYIYSEYDEDDLTYFLFYKLKVIERSINDFIDYYKKKMEESQKLRALTHLVPQFNNRQVKLLANSLKSPNKTYSISYHQIVNQISYETARKDLMILESNGYLMSTTKGKKIVYLPCIDKIKEVI
ncbi:MAG: Fic family protein [bacterium]|nr:Fic family protein [bacterium]